MISELLECRVCQEDLAVLEDKNDGYVYVVCGNCGSMTAFVEYKTEEEKEEAVQKAVYLWNMGKVIVEKSGE